jgi:hypothetical protein
MNRDIIEFTSLEDVLKVLMTVAKPSDPPKSPLKRGTMSLSPPFLRGVGGIAECSIEQTVTFSNILLALPYERLHWLMEKQCIMHCLIVTSINDSSNVKNPSEDPIFSRNRYISDRINQ